MLITEGSCVLNTLEVPHCKYLLLTIRQWDLQLREQWEQGVLTN